MKILEILEIIEHVEFATSTVLTLSMTCDDSDSTLLFCHTFDRFCFGEAFDPRFFTSTHEPATREGWEPTGDFSGGNRVGGTQDPYGKLQVIPSKMVVPGSVVLKWDDLKNPLKCLGDMRGTYHQFLFTTSWNKPEIMQSDVMVRRRWELHLPPKKEQNQIRKIFQDFTQVDVSLSVFFQENIPKIGLVHLQPDR